MSSATGIHIDWMNPDYTEVAKARHEMLGRIRACGPEELERLKEYYREAPGGIADFIEDWGVTFDPRMVELGKPASMPFVLFPRQREYVDFVIARWRERRPGLTEKSRDMGISWMAVGIGVALCVLHQGFRVGYGSRLEDYVDKVDEPKSLFWKARYFTRHLPQELRAGFIDGVHSPHMRMMFPETGASMVGEAGDNIGRGDRTSLYFVDEAAHLKRPKMVDAALSQTTNCRVDISSVNGPNNPFYAKRHSGKVEVFIFDWREDPRKDEAWYQKQCEDLDPIVVAQEIDRDYMASVEGVVIPSKWLQACVGAIKKLGLPPPTGAVTGAFDVADGGADRNAFVSGKGVEVSHAAEWAGKKGDDGDIFQSVERVFDLCDEEGVPAFRYDADGIGAGVRGDARIINERRVKQGRPAVTAEAYRGSEAVVDPTGEDVKGRKNEDYFHNRKAQAWWRVRMRALRTFRWVTQGIPCLPTEIISFREDCPELSKVIAELGQAQYKTTDTGHMLIQKKPDEMRSPNLGDAVVMKFAGAIKAPLVVSEDLLRRVRQRPRRRR